MKLFTALLVAWLCIGVLAGISQTELDEYLVVADKLESADPAAGVKMMEALTPQNMLALYTMYYVHSRGLYGCPVDRAKAGAWRKAIEKIWDGMSLTGYDIDFWQDRVIMDQDGNRINQAIHPACDCYLESMANLHGIGSRIVNQMAFLGDTSEIKKAMSQAALERKNCDAVLRIIPAGGNNVSQISPEKFQRLCESADFGHVPSMLAVASVLFDNNIGVPADYPRAKAYLKRAADICQSFQQKKCYHADQIVSQIAFLNERIPDVGQSTVELIAVLNSAKGLNETSQYAYASVIAGRDDHADCPYYRAMLIKDNMTARIRALGQAAEKGSPAAIRACIRQYANDDKASWYYYYLGGEYKIDDGRNTDFYAQSLSALERCKMLIGLDKYKENLALLAQSYPPAKARYDAEFAAGAAGREMEVEVGYEDKASAAWVDFGGKKGLKCVFQPSADLNYVDVTLPPGPQRSMIVYFTYRYNSELTKRVYFYAVYPDEKKELRALENMAVLPQSPQRLRLMCEPGESPAEIVIGLP